MRMILMVAGLLAWTSAQAGEAIDVTRAVDDDVSIVVKNVKGEVNVRPGSGNEMRLTGYLGDGTRGLEVSDGGSRLVIEVKLPRNARNVEDTVLNLLVPEDANLQIETVSADVVVESVGGERVQINTVSGEIEVESDPQHLELESVSGDISVRSKSRRIDLETVSGDIEGDDFTGEVSATTVSGEVWISTLEVERARFESVSGDIELELHIAEGGDVNIASLSGDVDLALAKALSADVDVQSFSGKIRSDQGTVKSARHGPEKSLSFRSGDGLGRISIESFSGDISIQSR